MLVVAASAPLAPGTARVGARTRTRPHCLAVLRPAQRAPPSLPTEEARRPPETAPMSPGRAPAWPDLLERDGRHRSSQPPLGASRRIARQRAAVPGPAAVRSQRDGGTTPPTSLARRRPGRGRQRYGRAASDHRPPAPAGHADRGHSACDASICRRPCALRHRAPTWLRPRPGTRVRRSTAPTAGLVPMPEAPAGGDRRAPGSAG